MNRACTQMWRKWLLLLQYKVTRQPRMFKTGTADFRHIWQLFISLWRLNLGRTISLWSIYENNSYPTVVKRGGKFRTQSIAVLLPSRAFSETPATQACQEITEISTKSSQNAYELFKLVNFWKFMKKTEKKTTKTQNYITNKLLFCAKIGLRLQWANPSWKRIVLPGERSLLLSARQNCRVRYIMPAQFWA